jgi:putative transposase
VIRWKLLIQHYDFVIEHIAGPKNVVADAMTRLVFTDDEEASNDDLENTKMSTTTPTTNNQTTETILALTSSSSTTLRNHQSTIIPREMYNQIRKVHNTYVGHHGVERTLDKLLTKGIRDRNLRRYVEHFIKTCPCCQKFSQIKPIIHTLPYTIASHGPMYSVSIDTIGPFPKSVEEYLHVLVVTDNFTRFVELFPLKTVEASEAALHPLVWSVTNGLRMGYIILPLNYPLKP